MIKTKTKSNEFIQRVNDALQRGRHTISDFELKSFERDARAILNVDQLDGYLAMGFVASLKRNLAETTHWHELALKCQPDSYPVLYNYAASLKALGVFSKARPLTDKLYELLLQTPPESITTEDVGMLVSTGRFAQSVNISRFEAEEDIRRVLQSTGMKDEYVEPHFNALEAVITKRELALSSTVISVDDMNQLITVIINLAATPNDCAEVNWEFCEQLAQQEISSIAAHHLSILVVAA